MQSSELKAGDEIILIYFPNVNGKVDRIDDEGRIWATLDQDVLDTPKNTSTPIAQREMCKKG